MHSSFKTFLGVLYGMYQIESRIFGLGLFVQFKHFCIILAMSTNHKHFHCLITVYWKVLSDDDNNECLWTFDAGPWKGEEAGNSPDEESAFCKAAIRRPANGYNIFQGPVQLHHLNIGKNIILLEQHYLLWSMTTGHDKKQWQCLGARGVITARWRSSEIARRVNTEAATWVWVWGGWGGQDWQGV